MPAWCWLCIDEMGLEARMENLALLVVRSRYLIPMSGPAKDRFCQSHIASWYQWTCGLTKCFGFIVPLNEIEGFGVGAHLRNAKTAMAKMCKRRLSTKSSCLMKSLEKSLAILTFVIYFWVRMGQPDSIDQAALYTANHVHHECLNRM